MRTDQSDEPRRGRARIAIAVWLGLISIFVVLDHVALSKLKRDMVTHAHDADMTRKLVDLEQRVDGIARIPSYVTPATFNAARQSIDDRLAKVEQSVSERASSNDVTELQDRLSGINTRLSRMSSAAAKARAAAIAPIAPVTPAALEPPFTVLGIELRGDERLLAVIPFGSHSLADVRLMRVGDAQGQWQLGALNGNAAEFRVDGRVQHIVVP